MGERREQRPMSGASRVSLVIVVGLAALTGACSKGGGSTAATSSSTLVSIGPTTTTAPAIPAIALEGATVTVGPQDEPAAPTGELARPAIDQAITSWITGASLKPLVEGTPAAGFESAFTALAATRLLGPDRATLVDEGLPKARAIRVATAKADVTVLDGPPGTATAATAQIDIEIRVVGVDDTRLSIRRVGDLLLLPDEGGQTWRIDSYRLTVDRQTSDPPGVSGATGASGSTGVSGSSGIGGASGASGTPVPTAATRSSDRASDVVPTEVTA